MSLRSFGRPSHALVDYHLERSGMPLHDVVGVKCKSGATTKNHGAVAGLWAKGCVLDDCVSVI